MGNAPVVGLIELMAERAYKVLNIVGKQLGIKLEEMV
ncbi:hypothetical protein M2246_003843 [Bacillus sp. LEw-kw-24]|nr:hypothetical protein [Bacillus sp. LEw-kw-24]MDH6559080.1 hypothetical protein [Bacillus sp. LEw-kw-2]MDH8705453.1 hypothetical protein [Stenotrophomonas sp. 1198]MDP9749149.1 hypothetical protein [Bacillus thuringiensis]